MAVINVCVGPDGKLTAAPTLDKTSGFPHLDEAAIKLTTAAIRPIQAGHRRWQAGRRL